MSSSQTPGAIARFEQAVTAKVAAGMTRQRAVAVVCREDPALQQDYLREYNSAYKTPRGARTAPPAEPSAIVEVGRRVDELVRGGMIRNAAFVTVFRNDSALHGRYLLETNKGLPKVEASIKRRFGIS